MFFHKLRTLQKHLKNVRLTSKLPGCDKDIYSTRLSVAIRARVRLDLSRIKRHFPACTDFIRQSEATIANILPYFSGKHQNCKQEAHGPRFAHLSDIATADMQMLCNIFPILSSQLMKISSFEQFLVLKKNIWAWQSMEHDHLNKLSITFQQKDQCEIWWKFA